MCEGIFAREDDAEMYAQELRDAGVDDARAQRRGTAIAHRHAGPSSMGRRAAGRQNPTLTREEAIAAFKELIAQREPGSMQIAEDLLLENGLTLVEVSKRHPDHHMTVAHDEGTFELDFASSRVDWEVHKASADTTRIMNSAWRRSIYYVFQGHGERLISRGGSYMHTERGAERAAAADAWAVAKRMREMLFEHQQGTGMWISDTKGREEVRVELQRVMHSELPDATAPEVYAYRAPPGKKTKQRTYPEAKDDIMAFLERKGWRRSTNLKVQHATTPEGHLRLWFKPQTIHYTLCQPHQHKLGDARAIRYELDIRAMSPEEFFDLLKLNFPNEIK